MCQASKKGARQTKLTTALWYWQHCCWHHQSRGFVKTPLLVPTNNCNSTFLLRGTTPRDVTWQNFWHGKIISRKNSSSFKFPQRKEKRKLFSKLQLFLLTGDFLDVCWWWRPLFPTCGLVALPCFYLHWQKAKFIQWQDFGHTLANFQLATLLWPPKIPSATLDCFKTPLCSGTPKEFFISFPLDIEHSDAIWEHWELFWQFPAATVAT